MARLSLLTDTQRKNLMAFPHLTEMRLIARHYMLSPTDINIIRRQQSPENELAFALHLCVLRYPGRVWRINEQLPDYLVEFVAQQLEINPNILQNYSNDPQLRRGQLRTLRQHYDFRPYDDTIKALLYDWILPTALSTNKGSVLMSILVDKMRQERIIIPKLITLEAFLHPIIQQTNRAIYDKLYKLTEVQLDEIERAIKHDPRADVVRRATCIRLYHQGYKATEIAKMISASRATVQNWHKRWREGGLEALADKPIPGRKPKATRTYQETLEQTLATDPHQLGYAFSVWTLERLSQHLERETGIALSVGRLGQWMSRWGYVYRQPKHSLEHKQDADVRHQVQKWLDELKKQPKEGIVDSSLWMKPHSV